LGTANDIDIDYVGFFVDAVDGSDAVTALIAFDPASWRLSPSSARK
jgi:hypothetical protein